MKEIEQMFAKSWTSGQDGDTMANIIRAMKRSALVTAHNRSERIIYKA